MPRLPRQAASIVAAAILSILTLSVFAVQQNNGPESAVQRFHEGLQQGDARAVAAVSFQSLDDPSFTELGSRVTMLMRAGAQVQLVHIERKDNAAIVHVSYSLPKQRLVTYIPFAALRLRGAWMVDSRKTLELMRELGLP